MKNKILSFKLIVTGLILTSLNMSFAQAESEKTFNLSVNPIGVAFGVGSVDFELGVSENISVGPNLTYLNVSGVSGGGVGAVMTYYIAHPRFTSGWFVRPFADFIYAGSALVSGVGFDAGADAGYWWFTQSGFNIGLGLGGQYVDVSASSTSRTLSTAEFRMSGLVQLGWAF